MLPNDTPPSGGGLYLIWLSDTHYYGGRTSDYRRRWATHLRDLKRGTHENTRMQNTYDKYGVFRAEAVGVGDRDLVEAEQEWLDKHFRTAGCMNISKSAAGGCTSRSEESRRRQSETIKSRPDLMEKARQSAARNRLPKGYKATPEHRANNAAAQRGKKQSPETIAKRAAALRGRTNTPETLAKMRAAAKRRVKEHGAPSHGAGTRALISEQQRGRVWLTRGGENTRVKPEGVDALLAEGWERGVTQREDLVRVKQAWITNGDEVRRIPESEVGVMLAAGWERGRVPLSERKPPKHSYQKVENPKSNHKGTVWVRRRDPAARGGWDARRVSSEEVGTLLVEGWERGMRPASQSRKSKVRSSWADPARREAARERARNQVNATRSTVWVNDGTTNRRVFPDEAVALLAAGWVRGRIARTR
jgi:hypothetical protein